MAAKAKTAQGAAEKENTLEENFELLEEVTSRLQSDDLPLEEAFENYKKGMDLIKKCSSLIWNATPTLYPIFSSLSICLLPAPASTPPIIKHACISAAVLCS